MADLFGLHRWSAVRHEDVELLLRLLLVHQVLRLQHFTFIADHIVNAHRVVATVVRAIVVDLAKVFLFARNLFKPWATGQLNVRVGIHPDLAIAHVAKYCRLVRLPRCDLRVRRGQAAIAIDRATLATLIAVLHSSSWGVTPIAD